MLFYAFSLHLTYYLHDPLNRWKEERVIQLYRETEDYNHMTKIALYFVVQVKLLIIWEQGFGSQHNSTASRARYLFQTFASILTSISNLLPHQQQQLNPSKLRLTIWIFTVHVIPFITSRWLTSIMLRSYWRGNFWNGLMAMIILLV